MPLKWPCPILRQASTSASTGTIGPGAALAPGSSRGIPPGRNEPAINAVHTILSQILTDEYADWKASGLRLVGEGLENWVFRADSPVLGALALKVPRERVYRNENDPNLDSRRLLIQEAELTAHTERSGVPVAKVHALHLSAELDFLVSAYVPADGSQPDERAMGRLTRSIHECPVPVVPLVAQDAPSLQTTLGARIWRRVRAVERLADVTLRLPNAAELAEMLSWDGERRCLLHMDMRPANLLTCGGDIAAVIDWSNALVGDPALEFARISEAGFLSGAFLEGHGEWDWTARLPQLVELLYRLDTAVMLALVFLSEAPHPTLAHRQVKRVLELHAALQVKL